MNFRDRFLSLYHTQNVRDEKVSLALAHWERGEIKTLVPSKIHWIMENLWNRRNCDGIATKLRRNVTLTKLWRKIRWKSVAIPSIPLRFCRVFHVPSVLGPNWLFNFGRLGGDRLQKVHPKCVKSLGVWNANTRIAFLFSDALIDIYDDTENVMLCQRENR